jgi:hypothetical protein
MRGDLVIDGRNALEPGAVRSSGLRYEGVGRRRDGEPAEPAAVTEPEAQPASTGSGPG